MYLMTQNILSSSLWMDEKWLNKSSERCEPTVLHTTVDSVKVRAYRIAAKLVINLTEVTLLRSLAFPRAVLVISVIETWHNYVCLFFNYEEL